MKMMLLVLANHLVVLGAVVVTMVIPTLEVVGVLVLPLKPITTREIPGPSQTTLLNLMGIRGEEETLLRIPAMAGVLAITNQLLLPAGKGFMERRGHHKGAHSPELG